MPVCLIFFQQKPCPDCLPCIILHLNSCFSTAHSSQQQQADGKYSYKCVISAELADKNQLEIGSRISFGNCRDKEDPMIYEAEVVGIYRVNQPIAPYMYGDTYRSENIIFTDLDFPEK